ncbi:MAG: YraN family protein [Planctomycetota bacterium]
MAAHYDDAGYTILARNVRTTLGELDLVARRGTLLVAVEVKTRRTHGAPERLVSAAELQRRDAALRALAPYLAPSAARLRLRVDIAAVRWRAGAAPEVRVFEGAERPLR